MQSSRDVLGLDRDTIQALAVDDLFGERSSFRPSTILQMPTQTGKTRTACLYIKRVLEEVPKGRVLVAVHMDVLLGQFAEDLDEMGIKYAIEQGKNKAYKWMRADPSIRVCLASKDSLQDRRYKKAETVLPLDASDAGAIPTLEFKHWKSARLSVWPKDFFTDVIFDECHLGTARTWMKVKDYFSDAFLIGLTA